MADTLFLECLLFVQEQSCGEWGEDIEREDAVNLAAFVRRQIAQAMSARHGQDPQGLEAKPASAVPQGCAQPSPETSS